MTVDLYGVLGVAKNADKAAIRRAYRKAAKSAHPDAGGSRQQFALTKLAVDILSDDARRAKYDATGDASEVEPDNRTGAMIAVLNAALDDVLGEIGQNGGAPELADLPGAMTKKMRARRDMIRKKRGDVERGVTVNERLVGRWSGESGEVLELVMRGRVRALRDMQAAMDRDMANLDAALAAVDGLKFRRDRPEPLAGAPKSPFEQMLTSAIRQYGLGG